MALTQTMKRIGLLGGMSWESTSEYYRLINEAVRERLGGLHSADCVLRSVDFAAVEELQAAGDWAAAGHLLAAEARTLAGAGAEMLVLCTNTMHVVAEEIASAVEIPFLHIADATANAARSMGLSTLGLLATRYTMEEGFYVNRLKRMHGLEVLLPPSRSRHWIHKVIYDELCLGSVKESSRAQARHVIASLRADGAEGIVLGCTELGLLIRSGDFPVPVIDTTRVHAALAVEVAIAGRQVVTSREIR